MKLKLRGTYTLEVAQSAEVVRRRLQHEITEDWFWFAAIRNRSRFWGYVEDEKMKLRYTGCRKDTPLVKRNDFSPAFHGTIHETAGKTVLHFRWRISIFLIAFMTVWFAVAGFGFFLCLLDTDFDAILMTGGMLLGGFALLMWGVLSGVKDTKAALRETVVMPGEWWREYEREDQEI